MMSTVTNMQVAVKYRQNVGSLLIDMSADNRTTTLGWHIDRYIGQVSVDISTDAWPICRPIYRATHLGRHIDWHSTDMSTDISVDTRPMCQLSVDMSVEGCTKHTWSAYTCVTITRFNSRVCAIIRTLQIDRNQSSETNRLLDITW